MNRQKKERLLEYLSQYITDNKKQKIDVVIKNRTRHVTVVLEDVYQSINASAVVRSAECFGVQDLHVVESRNQFRTEQGVAMGASKWLTTQSYGSVGDCYKTLKERGYKIIATTPHEKAYSLLDLPLSHKFALVFGTEEWGLTPKALELADEFVSIPMYGFTESFNVSVSVAICLHHIITKLHASNIPWRLTEDELLDLRLAWARAIVRGSDAHERKLFSKEA